MKSLYQINGFSTLKGRGPGQYGISISLDGKVAKKIYKNKQRRVEDCPLMKMMIAEINNKYGHLSFVDDSWFLRTIQLNPMSCSCFGVRGDDIKNLETGDDVSWHSHNIDNPEQASKLIAIWVTWFNHMAVFMSGKNILVTFPSQF